MNHVSTKWLRLIRWALVIYTTHFLVGFLYMLIIKKRSPLHATPFSLEVTMLAVIMYVYQIYVSVWIKKKNEWIITLLTYILALVPTFVILETTNVYKSPYIPVIVVIVFFGEALGEYVSPTIVFMMGTAYLLSLAGFFANNGGGTIGGLLAITAVTISAISSYLFWRKRYVLNENPELNRLNTLFKSRQQLSEVLLRSVADGVVATDTKGKINAINPAAAALLGWPGEEAINIDVKAVVKLAKDDGSPLPDEKYPFDESIRSKQAIKSTLQLTSRDGRKKIISLVVSPVVLPPNYDLVGTVGAMRDVSRQHQEEMQRSEFISTASHEMRTPVAAIEGYLALALNDKVANVDEKAREFLEKAHESTQHLGKLFQDLLTSAKAEDGRLVYRPQIVEIGAFLEQMIDSLRFTAEKKHLLLEFLVGANSKETAGNKVVRPLYYASVDADRLREVITNLFDNAVKYTDTGKISLGLTGDSEVVQFYIRDSGAGIPPDDIPHLFQKFYRVDSSATRSVGGTGLGLFISRKIIELSNGRIWVESELGKGSTFYINLPRISAEKATELQASEAKKPLPLGS